jgi:hypothetical protein
MTPILVLRRLCVEIIGASFSPLCGLGEALVLGPWDSTADPARAGIGVGTPSQTDESELLPAFPGVTLTPNVTSIFVPRN